MSNPGTALAGFVSGLRYEALPSHVQARVKEITIDALASAIAGRHGDETAMVERLALDMTGPGSSTVIAGGTMSPAGATLVNGYQVTAVTVCDVFRPALCHVTPQVVPPAIAIAQESGAGGKELLTAVAAGLEVTVRVGNALNYPAFRDRGWHSPGVIGPFGGASAVGSLLGLDADQQRYALSLAGSQSAGTFAHWGTPTIKFHQSRGALSGLLAGRLAAEGFPSAEDIFTNPDGGLLSTYTDGGRPELLTDQLGQRWDLEEIALRRWPAASSVQTMITSLFALLTENDVRTSDIASVKVGLSPTVYKLHASIPWSDRFRAQLSAPYLVAVIVHDRRCWLDQFDPSRFNDVAVDRFAREKVKIRQDPVVSGNDSVIEITMSDGSVLRDERTLAKGDPGDPLTEEEILEKFQDASRGLLEDEAVDDLLSGLLDLENVTDTAPLLARLGAPAVAR